MLDLKVLKVKLETTDKQVSEYSPLGHEGVYLPLYEVADTPFLRNHLGLYNLAAVCHHPKYLW